MTATEAEGTRLAAGQSRRRSAPPTLNLRTCLVTLHLIRFFRRSIVRVSRPWVSPLVRGPYSIIYIYVYMATLIPPIPFNDGVPLAPTVVSDVQGKTRELDKIIAASAGATVTSLTSEQFVAALAYPSPDRRCRHLRHFELHSYLASLRW
jgi:hypothetical protein